MLFKSNFLTATAHLAATFHTSKESFLALMKSTNTTQLLPARGGGHKEKEVTTSERFDDTQILVSSYQKMGILTRVF